MRLPSPGALLDSASTAWDLLPLVGGGVADLRRQPSAIVDMGPQRTVHRFRSRSGAKRKHAPVLLVPPLAAPASCFDLRRGCSLVEHLTAAAIRPTSSTTGRSASPTASSGLEHWVEEVLPAAIRTVSEDAGGVPVQPVGWCLGGIMLLLAAAGDRDLPLTSISLIASPFDFTRVRLFAPIRQLSRLTGGALGTALYRVLGGAPAPLVSLGFRLTSWDRYLTRPLFLATQPRRPRDDRADGGRRRLHGEHARLPRPHLRPALPRASFASTTSLTGRSSSATTRSTWPTCASRCW